VVYPDVRDILSASGSSLGVGAIPLLASKEPASKANDCSSMCTLTLINLAFAGFQWSKVQCMHDSHPMQRRQQGRLKTASPKQGGHNGLGCHGISHCSLRHI
jgi:hypothetical protein